MTSSDTSKALRVDFFLEALVEGSILIHYERDQHRAGLRCGVKQFGVSISNEFLHLNQPWIFTNGGLRSACAAASRLIEVPRSAGAWDCAASARLTSERLTAAATAHFPCFGVSAVMIRIRRSSCDAGCVKAIAPTGINVRRSGRHFCQLVL